MVHLEYVGSKPMISSKGVSFSVGKRDKYEFLDAAAHTLKMLQNFEKGQEVERIKPDVVHSEQDIMDILYKSRPDFDSYYQEEIAAYKHNLDEDERKVDSSTLTKLERETLKGNYRYMRKYREQRATNKIVYEELINASVALIFEKRIKQINTPFSMTFLHVLESLQTTISLRKEPPRTNLEVQLEHETPFARFDIEYYLKPDI